MPTAESNAQGEPAAAVSEAEPHQVDASAAPPGTAGPALATLPALAALLPASLTLSSKNYSSWSLRGWLMTKLAGLPFTEVTIDPDNADAKKEILLLAPSIRVPCLTHGDITVWDTLAIGEYLNEVIPDAGLLPAHLAARAHCRAVCGEMHSGFSSLRSALPMNLRGDYPGHKVWARAAGDIERIVEIWGLCLQAHGGPFLYGAKPCMADAMYAPVVTRFLTYHVQVDGGARAYCETVMAMAEMQEWVAAARDEQEDIEELDMEF